MRTGSKLAYVSTDKGWLRIADRQNDRNRNYIYLGLEDTKANRKIAEEIAQLVAKDIEAGTYDESHNKYKYHQTLGKRIIELSPTEMYSQWIKEKILEIDQVTAKWYIRIENELDELFPRLKAKDLKGTHCKQYIKFLQQKGNSPYVIKRKIQACNACWNWLIENHYLSFNPWSSHTNKVKVPPKALPEPYSRDEIERILKAFENHNIYWQYKPFVEFLFFTGCRTGEAIGLQWKNVANDFSTVTIESQFTRGKRKPTKTGDVRTFKPSERVRELLALLKKKKQGDDDVVFKYNWHIINLANFRGRAWKRCLEIARVPYKKPYVTRATFVSMALKEGLPPICVAQITGHNPATMFQHYAGYIEKTPELPF